MNEILDIATRVRKQCEIFAESDEARSYDFYKSGTLMCMCAVASYALVKSLKDNGIESELVIGKFDGYNCHSWVETSDKIIDITASQFGLKDIYITSIDDKRYSRIGAVDNLKKLAHWGNQRPNNSLAKKILAIKFDTH